VGSPEFMFAILDFHALGPYQSNEVVLWARPNSCLLLSFTSIGAISEQRVTFVGSLGLMPSAVFYTHWGNLRLTCCFCGIARTHGRYAVSHAPGQHQINELLPWNHPSSCSLVISMHWGSIRLTNCFYWIAQIHDFYMRWAASD